MPMEENYTFLDINPDQDNEQLFDKHVSQGHPHLIEIDNLLSQAYGGFDIDDI